MRAYVGAERIWGHRKYLVPSSHLFLSCGDLVAWPNGRHAEAEGTRRAAEQQQGRDCPMEAEHNVEHLVPEGLGGGLGTIPQCCRSCCSQQSNLEAPSPCLEPAGRMSLLGPPNGYMSHLQVFRVETHPLLTLLCSFPLVILTGHTASVGSPQPCSACLILPFPVCLSVLGPTGIWPLPRETAAPVAFHLGAPALCVALSPRLLGRALTRAPIFTSHLCHPETPPSHAPGSSRPIRPLPGPSSDYLLHEEYGASSLPSETRELTLTLPSRQPHT